MTTTNGNRKILDLKRWEFMAPAPANNVAGTFISSYDADSQLQFYLPAATTPYVYDPEQDGWMLLPSPAFSTGTYGAGNAGCVTAGLGISGTVLTSGTTNSIQVPLTFARSVSGCKVQVLTGANAGQLKTIISNTVGASSIITFSEPSTVTFSGGDIVRLLTPFWFGMIGGTQSNNNTFKYYNYATNTWHGMNAIAGSLGTDGRLVATSSWRDNKQIIFDSGIVTSSSASTLVHDSKLWETNQWVSGMVFIASGTGAGQIRTITSNTSGTLNITPNWTSNPDSTSLYRIHGHDDHLYYIGNNAVTLYRYSISTNTWVTITPNVARAAAAAAGCSAHWIYGVTDPLWVGTNGSGVINGRRIYSFRGGGSAVLDYYDIPSNTWVNAVTYAPATETFTTGSVRCYDGKNSIYIHKDATGRWFRYDIPYNNMVPWSTMLYPNSTAVVGDTCFDIKYRDGDTEIEYIHMILNTSPVHLRQMVI